MKGYIKICGVTTVEDALMCASLGVNAIGLNFWKGSRRYLQPESAHQIVDAISATGVERVGVFVNPSIEEVKAAFDSGLIQLAQFHGDETPQFCQQFAGQHMKALRLQRVTDMAPYPCERILVDSVDARAYGGTGKRADWVLAAQAAKTRRVILAGGLSVDNVTQAILAVRPWGIDVASGVEKGPGVKDEKKLKEFVTRARAVLK